jgi:hypothetical protein
MEQNKLITYIGKNRLMIVLIILTLLTCAWTIHNTQQYIDQCNTHWQEQIEQLHCISVEELHSFPYHPPVPGTEEAER